jgi:hypothetical protein
MVLMLVATSVVSDTRVLREAQSLVKDGFDVIIVGRNVPTDFQPPKGISIRDGFTDGKAVATSPSLYQVALDASSSTKIFSRLGRAGLLSGSPSGIWSRARA